MEITIIIIPRCIVYRSTGLYHTPYFEPKMYYENDNVIKTLTEIIRLHIFLYKLVKH